jgi:hypothetical protein
MTKREIEKYLIWSGFTYDDDSPYPDDSNYYSLEFVDDSFKQTLINVEVREDKVAISDGADNNYLVSFDKFKEIFAFAVGVELITTPPLSWIIEKVKSLNIGDFIVMRIVDSISKGIITSVDDTHVYYVENGCIDYIYISVIEDIISIKHNNFEEFINDKTRN